MDDIVLKLLQRFHTTPKMPSKFMVSQREWDALLKVDSPYVDRTGDIMLFRGMPVVNGGIA
jgi:hypothetical protein